MTTFNFREPGEFGDGATMTESNVSPERLQEMLDAEIPLDMSVVDAREIITLALEALALRTPSDGEVVAWTPEFDAVVAVAKDMAEYLVGKRPADEQSQRAAQFLFSCIEKGALSPLRARPQGMEVKPLEWKLCDNRFWRAEIAGCSYEVFNDSEAGRKKSEAEARHRARILSALTPERNRP